jgi:hypothetical protein
VAKTQRGYAAPTVASLPTLSVLPLRSKLRGKNAKEAGFGSASFAVYDRRVLKTCLLFHNLFIPNKPEMKHIFEKKF